MADELKVICITDEALDVEALPPSTLLRYIETRDMSLFEGHFKPGSSPQVFVIREIPSKLFEWVEDQPTDNKRRRAAFRAGVVRVENLRSADGMKIENATGLAKHDNGTLRDEELERFDPSEILEIGEVAFVRSFFRRQTARVYQLPPSLAERWVAQVALRAAQNQASPDPSSGAA